MLLHTCSNKSMLPPVTFSLGFVSVYVKFPNMSTYDLSPLQHQKGRKIPAEITIHIVWKSSQIGISHLWHFPPIFVLLKSSCIQICPRCWMRLFLWLTNTVEMATVKWTPTLMCLLILITFGHASEAAVTVKGWGCTHTLQNVILPFFFYCISSSSDDTMKYRPF